jgi:hypothetical protein
MSIIGDTGAGCRDGIVTVDAAIDVVPRSEMQVACG